jgi:RarD protein
MKKSLPTLKLIISMAIFGTVGIFVRYVGMPSGFVAMIRGFVGVGFILLWMLATKKRIDARAIKANLIVLILSGIFIGINWIFLFEAYRFTTVATATLCYYMAPVFVILLSPIILKEKVAVTKTVAVLVAVVGMALVCEPWGGGLTGDSLIGIVLALLAAVFYAAVTVTNKKLHDISSLDRTVTQLFVASAAVLPYTLLAEEVTAEMFDPTSILLLITLGALHTGLAYLFFFTSIEKLSAVTVSLFSYVDPISAVILSLCLLGEPMTLVAAIGAVVIILSMIASELELPKKAKK